MAEKEQSQMRIIVFKSSGKEKPKEFHCSHKKMFIGRQATNGSAKWQGLDIQSDRLVSRKHAGLFKKGGRWFLEDLGSKHGTQVDGRQIKGEGAVELLPGTPVQMGTTVWTLIPSAWLYLRKGKVILYGPCSSSLSYAAFHCGVPVIGFLAARNFGRARSKPMSATLEIQGFSRPIEILVPAVDPGKNRRLKNPKFRFRIEKLRRITEPMPTRLLLKLNGKTSAFAEKQMEVLGFWDWSHEPTARKTIAAFVSPRNPILERLVAEARASLADLAGTEAFSELLRSGREHGEQLILQAIYQTLSENHAIHWLPPEITLSAGAGKTYQTVRPMHRIFPGGFKPEGQGTCLDLAVLMAGCLENAGLCPVLVFTGDRAGNPHHALAGCWAGPVPGDRPVLNDKAFLLRELRTSNLYLVESTGCTRGAGERIPFDEAVQRAEEQVSKTDWLSLVDIKVLRPPTGSITPIDSPWEPEVDSIYEEAKNFAQAKRRELIETVHLFYGLFAARGEVISWLCKNADLPPQEVCAKLDPLVSSREFEGEPQPTRTYNDCRRFAEELAWESGVPSVREQDVVWAVLVKGLKSLKMSRSCKRIGLDPKHLANLLMKQYPCPMMHFSSFSYSSGPEG